MDQGNQSTQIQYAKTVVTDRPRGFSSESLIPVVRMKSISDFDFRDVIHLLVKEAAVPDRRAILAKANDELGRETVAVPIHDFVDELRRPLARKDPAGKLHKAFVSKK